MKTILLTGVAIIVTVFGTHAPSTDWRNVFWREPAVRHLRADKHPGDSRDLRRRVPEGAHESGFQQAVARDDAVMKVANLDQFEQKTVDGEILINRKRSRERFRGMGVKFATDPIMKSPR